MFSLWFNPGAENETSQDVRSGVSIKILPLNKVTGGFDSNKLCLGKQFDDCATILPARIP